MTAFDFNEYRNELREVEISIQEIIQNNHKYPDIVADLDVILMTIKHKKEFIYDLSEKLNAQKKFDDAMRLINAQIEENSDEI